MRSRRWLGLRPVATQAEVEQVRRALNALAAAAEADWQSVWDSLRSSDRVMVNRALSNGWSWVLERYGNMSATLAADFFDVQAAELNLARPRTVMAAAVNERQATARLGWALSTPDQSGNLSVLLDELVKQPYRDTLANSASASGAGFARVPSGSETCAFCLMLASRGAVYRSAKTAGDGHRYHGKCDCVPTLVRDERDYPKGYDPGALSDVYSMARREAGSGDPGKILAELRRQQCIN